MRFNPKARLDTSRVRDGGGAGGGAGGGLGGGGMRIPLPGGARAGGGLGLVVIVAVILLLKVFGGIDLTGAITGGGGYDPSRFQGDSTVYASCQTGQDANDHPDTCGLVAVENSLVDYWQGALAQQAPNASFQPEAAIVTFSGGTSTAGCGQASSGMGPFYCPNDQTIYFDPSFFTKILQQQLNGPSGAFVEPYVIGHEFGHHVQNLLGTMNKVKTQQGPNSDSVRLELQADCYAGMWARNATRTEDSEGNVLIQDLTQQDVQEAIAAAKSVGDDTIQRETTGRVQPEQWTHGSSEARVKWFTIGFNNGTLQSCDTFSVPTVE
jgi:predicted metalloprotease